MNSIHTPLAEISFNKNESVLHVKVFENVHMDVENARLHFEQINNLVKGKKYLALVDATNYFTIEKEAWEYASSPDVASNRIAVAQYNSSLATTLATNFYKTAYKTAMPMKIFRTRDSALKWLKSHLG